MLYLSEEHSNTIPIAHKWKKNKHPELNKLELTYVKSEVPQKWVTGGHQNCHVGSAFILIQQQKKKNFKYINNTCNLGI